MISEDREMQLWQRLDELRTTENFGFEKIVAWGCQEGMALTAEELIWLLAKSGRIDGEFAVPLSLARFFVELLRSRDAKSLLDPAAGLALLGLSISSPLSLSRVDLVCRNVAAKQLLDAFPRARPSVLMPLLRAGPNIIIGDFESARTQLASSYDAVLSIPPFTGQRQRRSYTTEQGEVVVTGDPSELLILDAAKHLAPEGIIAFVMPPRFTWDDRLDSVRANLPRFGLHLTGLLRLKPGTFSTTGIAFDLAIIERIDRDRLFVAELPDHDKGQDELLTRLRERREGPHPTQGRLVPGKTFRGLEVLEAHDRTKELGLRKGMAAVPFGKAIREIVSPKRRGKDFEPCAEHPDGVYLPEMASTPATTAQTELPERLKSYLQLIANTDVVLPGFLVDWLNTPLGNALRQSTMKGITIPRISKSALADSILYLPPLEDQQRAMEALATIRRLRGELGELETRIWDRPRQVQDVLDALANVNHEERFDDWLETLPFPLASILRTYHALDRLDKDRYERLLHFFEALAAFVATIHLSAFRSAEAAWTDLRPKVSRALQQQHMTLERPTFGLWRLVLESLATEARKLVHGNDEQQAQARSLFHVADLAPIEILTSKKLLSLLQKTNDYRNRWTGHGGAVGPAEATERHKLLRLELDQVRELFGASFLRFELLEPREAEILPGPLYRCNARRVMGSNPAFEHSVVELTSPAYTGGLYLHNPGHDQALNLIGFVKVKNTPQPACYFFNREDLTGTHMVSYHSVDEPDFVDKSHPLKQLFSELSEPENAS